MRHPHCVGFSFVQHISSIQLPRHWSPSPTAWNTMPEFASCSTVRFHPGCLDFSTPQQQKQRAVRRNVREYLKFFVILAQERLFLQGLVVSYVSYEFWSEKKKGAGVCCIWRRSHRQIKQNLNRICQETSNVYTWEKKILTARKIHASVNRAYWGIFYGRWKKILSIWEVDLGTGHYSEVVHTTYSWPQIAWKVANCFYQVFEGFIEGIAGQKGLAATEKIESSSNGQGSLSWRTGGNERTKSSDRGKVFCFVPIFWLRYLAAKSWIFETLLSTQKLGCNNYQPLEEPWQLMQRPSWPIFQISAARIFCFLFFFFLFFFFLFFFFFGGLDLELWALPADQQTIFQGWSQRDWGEVLWTYFLGFLTGESGAQGSDRELRTSAAEVREPSARHLFPGCAGLISSSRRILSSARPSDLVQSSPLNSNLLILSPAGRWNSQWSEGSQWQNTAPVEGYILSRRILFLRRAVQCSRHSLIRILFLSPAGIHSEGRVGFAVTKRCPGRRVYFFSHPRLIQNLFFPASFDLCTKVRASSDKTLCLFSE